MELPNVEAMTSSDKIWFARAITGMIVSDGHVDPSEMEFLKEAIGFLEDKDEVTRLMAIVKEGQPPAMEAAHIESKQAFIILKYLAELMVVDSVLSPKEVAYFLSTGKMLGFSDVILTKLWKTARTLLEKTLPHAGMDSGRISTYVSLTRLDESKCTFRLGKALMPSAKITLRMKKGDQEFWEPIVCRLHKQHKDKFDEESYTVTANFEQKISEPHGIWQTLRPEDYVPEEDTKLTPSKNSLTGRLVRCYICGNPRVKFFQLRARSMITKSNIFGVTSFVKPAGELEFCDFNKVQVASCQKCGFTSNVREHFKRERLDKAPFDVDGFTHGWDEKIEHHMSEAKNAGDEFYSEDRNDAQAYLSYDMGITTLEHLLELTSDPQEIGNLSRKLASMLLIQAELKMENYDKEAAEGNLHRVVDILEPIFEELNGVTIIHVCLLLFQIKVYFKDLQSAAQYMKFMDNYDNEGKLQEGTEEFKAYKVSGAKLKATFDDREMLFHDKLTHFHVDD